MRNIVIVGFMGTGKTVVAKALAEDMGKTYVSTDDMIEKSESLCIKDIFRGKGEQYFRQLEKTVIGEIAERCDQVIDTGGGAILDARNFEALKKSGVIIALWADVDVILKRTSGDGPSRPLLDVDDPSSRARDLLESRRPFYEKAEFHVNTGGMSVTEVVEKIKSLIKESGTHEKSKA